jgi:hypothetical protein
MVRIRHYIVQLTERGVIGDTPHNPGNSDLENHNNFVHHNPSNPDPENHNNHRGMSSSHKNRCNKLGEMLRLPGKR